MITVKCMNDNGYKFSITEGKLYNAVTTSDFNYLYIYEHKDNSFIGCFSSKRFAVIEQAEEVNWELVEPWTKIQYRDYESSEWSNGYFLRYETGTYAPFIITHRDPFISATSPLKFRAVYCKLYKEGNNE